MLPGVITLVFASSLSQLGPSALDSSSSSLSAATSVVTIGSQPLYWSAIPSTPSSYNVSVGTTLSFHYSDHHNVELVNSRSAFDSCDFTGSTELASSSYGTPSSTSHGRRLHGADGHDEDAGSTPPNLYEAVANTPGTLYIVCRVGGHCAAGQKIQIDVYAPSPPRAAPAQVVIEAGGSLRVQSGGTLNVGAVAP